jgi:hypothetical protein
LGGEKMTRCRWEEKEIDFLIKNYSSMEYSKLGEALGRTRQAIERKLFHMNLSLSSDVLSARRSAIAKRLFENQSGESNPNWKGGISKNNYHYKKIQVERYPEKTKARNAVRRAVKNGMLIKLPCAQCGNRESFAHHDDYTKPLEVVWLCRKHHRARHNGMH